MSTFGERVRAERKRSGRTMRSVAAEAGISAAYLCDIEQGRRDCPSHTAALVAKAIGVDAILIDPWVRVPLSWVDPEKRRAVLV